MMLAERFVMHRLTEPADLATRLAHDVRTGLTGRDKSLPSVYFYDERGSRLFDEITTLPEYYLTRAETEILDREATSIMETYRPDELMEIGAGYAHKTRTLLAAMHAASGGDCYAPIDVAEAPLMHAGSALTSRFPWLTVEAHLGDFTTDLHRIERRGKRMIVLLGSTIGNFPPTERSVFLAEVAASLSPDDTFLLGVDLIKDRATMLAAYDDARGVSAEFNRNVLHVINRQLDGDIPVDDFAHGTRYDEALACMEQSLTATRSVDAYLRKVDLEIHIAEGERIHTEWSCKFSLEGVTEELAGVGLTVERAATDSLDRFLVVIARPSAS